jgi:TRAP transporter 4TM/12TM fusion protein
VGQIGHINAHYAFGFTLVFLLTIKQRPRLWWLVAIPALLVLACTAYIGYYQDDIQMRVGVPNAIDLWVGSLFVILSLITAWMAFGPVLPVIGIIAVAYFLFGQYLPGFLYHFPADFSDVVSKMCIGMDGMFGVSGAISANFIFLFILMGGLLEVCGATDFFIELGKAAGKKLRGGPAQTAVISSCLVGSVTGSAMANVAITGAYTIPLMKKVGYRPHEAGAIEAAASTGGQVMPPIMGASAFMMVGITGIQYVDIMKAAILPSLLYYLAVGLYCEFRARAIGIEPMKEDVDRRLLFSRAHLFFIPLVLLIYMLIENKSPMFAIFYGILTLVGLSLLRRETRPSLAQFTKGVVEGAATGAKIAVCVAVVGFIMSSVTGTGLGVKISSAVVNWSGGSLILLCILAMLGSILLGMGVPTLGAYVLVAMLVAPAMVKAGVSVLQAHFFCLFFAIFSGLTPPVALAAMVGAAMAKADYMKTAFESWKISLPAYIIAYVMIWNPVVMGRFGNLPSAVLTILCLSLALLLLSNLITGHGFTRLTVLEAVLATVGMLCLLGYCFAPGWLWLLSGGALFAAFAFSQVKARSRAAALPAGAAAES